MPQTALQNFIEDVRGRWSTISTSLVEHVRDAMDRLSAAHEEEPWLASLLAERPATRELDRDADHGFMLLAHSEQEGLYRPPHDHGRAWVCYAVQSGELEIGAYIPIQECNGFRLVRREQHVLRSGQARLYLPGDIHDTRCITDKALVFRFTERDLRLEDQVEHRLTRYVAQGGEWIAPQHAA